MWRRGAGRYQQPAGGSCSAANAHRAVRGVLVVGGWLAVSWRSGAGAVAARRAHGVSRQPSACPRLDSPFACVASLYAGRTSGSCRNVAPPRHARTRQEFRLQAPVRASCACNAGELETWRGEASHRTVKCEYFCSCSPAAALS